MFIESGMKGGLDGQAPQGTERGVVSAECVRRQWAHIWCARAAPSRELAV